MSDLKVGDVVTPRTCACSFCKRYAKIVSVKGSRDVDSLVALVDELHEALANTEDDLNHKNCILDGSWPSAVEQLEAALDRAKGKRAAR